MKRLLCAVSILSLIVPSAVAAQQQQQDQRSNRPDRQNQHRPGRPNNPQNRPPTIQPVPNQGQQPGRPGHGVRPGQPTIQPVPNQGQRPGRPGHGVRPGQPTIQPVPNPGQRPGRPTIQPVPNRPTRPPNFRPIRGPVFHYPRGYHYRRWSIGLILPSIFLSNYYYYDQYASFGLYPPPFGYRWVRYGPDLLLVNMRTGRIRDVVYGAFY